MFEQQKNNGADALSVILTRRSIRRYTGEPVSQQEQRAILEAIFAGPTACDFRPVEVVVVTGQQTREAVAKIGRYTKMVANAPLCLIVCGNRKKQGVGSLLINDCSAAIENALLAAHAIGLGAVWCGVVEDTSMQKKLKALLSLPEHVDAMGIIAIGHPDETRDVPQRYDEKRVHQERW